MLDVGGVEKAKFVQELHAQVQENICKRGEQVAQRVNKGRKKMVSQPGDWVWVHFWKIRFPEIAKSKPAPRGDGPFIVLERLNDNAYVIDLPGEYYVSYTFNVADLSPYHFVGEGLDLRTNPFQEGEDDTIIGAESGKPVIPSPLKAVGRPTTRAMTRKKQEGLAVFIWKLLDEEGTRMELKEGIQSVHPGRVAAAQPAPTPPGRVTMMRTSPGAPPGPGGFSTSPTRARSTGKATTLGPPPGQGGFHANPTRPGDSRDNFTQPGHLRAADFRTSTWAG